MNDSKGKP